MELTVFFPVRSDLWIPRESLLELGTEIKQRRGRTFRRGISEDQLEIEVGKRGGKAATGILLQSVAREMGILSGGSKVKACR